jgi:hypothetical protein
VYINRTVSSHLNINRTIFLFSQLSKIQNNTKMQRTNSMLIVSTKPKNLNPTNLVYYLKLTFPLSTLQRFTFVLVLLCIIVSCYSAMACECDYHSGGCYISVPAAPGFACRCSFKGFAFICYGSEVGCRDSSSHYCRNPDKTKDSCILGGGDCGGY